MNVFSSSLAFVTILPAIAYLSKHGRRSSIALWTIWGFFAVLLVCYSVLFTWLILEEELFEHITID
ncbi:MAG: hypothetical protein Greene041662_107 [Candidatus Peregrinibacteria bacterium Greene0416_62]|nr:MAG: hypothetical protein Greene041662_107 [Candidatus Peregrinibacteria bacterium Greene0416_62]TSC99258.1 MAG: hypothetical protein Greene101449_670 [Candidatus Peregrinibacteria bacterium Greene1014_49]